MKKFVTVLLTVLMVFGSTAAVFAATPADGTYSVATTLQGGSGRTSVKSPSTLTVSGGQMTATVVFNSSNFTWMQVGGVTYNNANPGGNSTFNIPVSALDTGISVSAETVAMSEPHVINYVLTFSSSGVSMEGQGGNSGESSSGQTDADTEPGDTPAEADDEEQEEEEVVVDDGDVIEINNTMSNSTSVSEDMIKNSDGKTMSLETASGRVDFDEEATAAVAKAAKGGITLTMSDVTSDHSDSGFILATDISLTDEEGNLIYEPGDGGNLEITLNLGDETETTDGLSVRESTSEGYIDVEADFDEEEKTVTFATDHLGIFGVEKESSNSGLYIAAGIGAAVIIIAGIAFFVVKCRKRNDA